MESVSEYEPAKLEKKILGIWAKSQVMEKTLVDERVDRFSFLEGPPTANAPPALHHVEVRCFKDVVNRFNYMQGKSVPRKAGWDCHGLPVEVQVEKRLKLSHKKDIEEYGVDRFVEECRKSVFSHIKEWDELTKRMAYWVDLKNPYITMDNDYIESVWWSLKTLWEKDLLYEGYKVVPLCSRCGTPLSSHEVAQGYQSVKEETVIVSFPVKGEDFSLLAWTTTPWTLLSNLALAVNPDITYSRIKFKGEQYVLAKELAEKRFPEADEIESFKGEKLIGLQYTPLFNHFIGKLEKPAWRVVSAVFVTTDEGTGIVHIAPAFGEDDYNVGVENDLPLVNPIGLDGKFTSDVAELEGIFAKDADPKIVAMLEERGSIITKFPYEHDYPFCWRCQTPLLYYSMKSWFVKVAENVPKLIEQNNKVKWYPATIGTGRFGNWVENARDWGLSRNRFWGTPLPIWTCECGKQRCVGSRKELMDEAIGDVKADLDLHRPYVDAVKIRCSCGGQMSRVEYVIDCWYDSGAAAFAQYHYPFENKELFEKSHPYDFISEATDQTRGWFYTLLVISTLLFEKPAYKSCLVGGLLLDQNGEKMSKSKNNIINPWELFDKEGADAVRLQMCTTAPWNAKRFGVEGMNEQAIPLLRTLWNCYSFTVRYMMLDSFDPKGEKQKNELQMEDKWILEKAKQYLSTTKALYSENEYHHVFSEISNFITEDISRWYIKLIRDRLWLENEKGKINPSKHAAYTTLTSVFKSVCIMLAPIAPFITEEIHQNLLSSQMSIHQCMWPKDEKADLELITSMDIVRSIFEAASKARQDAKIKLRYPIASISITGDETVKTAVESLKDIIAKQLNSKEVKFTDSVKGLGYKAVADFKVIGPKFGKDAGKIASAISDDSQTSKRIKEHGKEEKIGGFTVTAEMILEIRLEAGEGQSAESFNYKGSSGVVVIDTVRTENLVNESLARDMIRHIQQMRKDMNLEEMQKINVKIERSKPVEAMLKGFESEISHEVRAEKIELMEKIEEGETIKFEGQKIIYTINL